MNEKELVAYRVTIQSEVDYLSRKLSFIDNALEWFQERARESKRQRTNNYEAPEEVDNDAVTKANTD
jgi:hypothetical protein